MGEMMEGRVHVEVSCGRNGTVLTAEKRLWENTIGGKRDRLGRMKQANIFTLVGKAAFFHCQEKNRILVHLPSDEEKSSSPLRPS